MIKAYLMPVDETGNLGADTIRLEQMIESKIRVISERFPDYTIEDLDIKFPKFRDFYLLMIVFHLRKSHPPRDERERIRVPEEEPFDRTADSNLER